MNLILGILVSALMLDGEMVISRGKPFDPVPESHDRFLQTPVGVEFDTKGRMYVLDTRSRAIFVWNADGSFHTSFGKQGDGPGEFQFVGERSIARGFVSVLSDRIYVYDGARRTLSEFDMDFKFINSSPFTGHGGWPTYFAVTHNRNILLWQMNNEKEVPSQALTLYNMDREVVRTFYSAPQNYFRKTGITEDSKTLVFPYKPKITMFYDSHGDRIFVGQTDQSSFDIFDNNGRKLRTVKFKSRTVEVSEEDKDEYLKSAFWLKQKPEQYIIRWPDERPGHEVILSIPGDRFLLYETSPFTNVVRGICIDNDGKTLGRFSFTCGENGSWWSANNRLLAIQTDESGDFVLQELFFPK